MSRNIGINIDVPIVYLWHFTLCSGKVSKPFFILVTYKHKTIFLYMNHREGCVYISFIDLEEQRCICNVQICSHF